MRRTKLVVNFIEGQTHTNRSTSMFSLPIGLQPRRAIYLITGTSSSKYNDQNFILWPLTSLTTSSIYCFMSSSSSEDRGSASAGNFLYTLITFF